jgi:hypothetical protein
MKMQIMRLGYNKLISENLINLHKQNKIDFVLNS